MLKKPWRDGTVALVLEPVDLCARVAALIPAPRFHMVTPVMELLGRTP